MGTHTSANGTSTASIEAVTCGPIHSSTKTYLEVSAEGSTLRVPVRRISLTNDTTFDVYDTSGSYTGTPARRSATTSPPACRPLAGAGPTRGPSPPRRRTPHRCAPSWPGRERG